MIQLADRIANMPPSQTIAMAQKARELKAQGHDIISLSLGEPDFPTPLVICDAAKYALDEGYFYYPPVDGFVDLKDAIIEKFKKDNQLIFERENIVVSTGAKQSIANVILSLVNPGDHVLLPAPYWVSYPLMVQMAEAEPVSLPTTIKTNFKITPAQLAAAITDKTKLMIFSTPCNPTGAVYSPKELQALADVIAQHPKLHVVCDEIYEHINFTGQHASLAAIEAIKPQVITVNGLSKGYAMTGWRLGYMAASVEVAKACTKVQSQFTSGACAITQRAAITALNMGEGAIRDMQQAYCERRDVIISALQAIPGVEVNSPDGAFYAFPDVSYYLGKVIPGGDVIRTVDELSLYLLEKAQVATVAGSAFGDDRCIRLSFAIGTDKLLEATSRIQQALEVLQ